MRFLLIYTACCQSSSIRDSAYFLPFFISTTNMFSSPSRSLMFSTSPMFWSINSRKAFNSSFILRQTPFSIIIAYNRKTRIVNIVFHICGRKGMTFFVEFCRFMSRYEKKRYFLSVYVIYITF